MTTDLIRRGGRDAEGADDGYSPCDGRPQPTSRLYAALTQPGDLAVWMGAPTLARPEVGSVIEVHHDQGQRIVKIEITALEGGKLVRWRVLQPVWSSEAPGQIITWTLRPIESPGKEYHAPAHRPARQCS